MGKIILGYSGLLLCTHFEVQEQKKGKGFLINSYPYPTGKPYGVWEVVYASTPFPDFCNKSNTGHAELSN